MIKYQCPRCGKEMEFDQPTISDVVTAIQNGKVVICKPCKPPPHQIPKHVTRSRFWQEKNFKDKDYDDKRDKYATATQLYTAQEIAERFNIAMRLDPAVPGISNVGSVIRNRQTDPGWTKSMIGVRVSGVKGGRRDGATVMGCPARRVRGLVPPDHEGTHKDDEWLHLWGDNLGGPSEPRNFVSGSYAANTEMLVIEQALAQNSGRTRYLALDIEAECSAQHFGEYLTYRVVNPANPTTPFEHLIDLSNRYFSRADVNTVQARIDAFLLLHAMKGTI
jgi:hypothetical protein